MNNLIVSGILDVLRELAFLYDISLMYVLTVFQYILFFILTYNKIKSFGVQFSEF